MAGTKAISNRVFSRPVTNEGSNFDISSCISPDPRRKGPYGYPHNGVPVLAPHLLKHFLKDAQARFHGDIEETTGHMYSVPLYNSLDEAVRVFPEYAGCPTLINLYNALITQISAKYEVPGKDFPPVFTTSLDISKVTSERYMKVLKQIAKGHLRKNF